MSFVERADSAVDGTAARDSGLDRLSRKASIYRTQVGNVRFGSWLCKNSATRNGDRTNVRPNRRWARKNSQAGPISIDLRKIILLAFQFFTFSHSLGQKAT
jgi:hypothetical protein